MPLYSVTSPTYDEVEYIDSWVASRIPVSDYYLVNALTSRDASWAAYYRAKSNNDGWYREIDGHPLRGVKVEVMPPIPVLIYDERLEEYIETGEFYMPDPKEWAGEKYYVDAIVNTEVAYIL